MPQQTSKEGGALDFKRKKDFSSGGTAAGNEQPKSCQNKYCSTVDLK